MEAKLSKVPNLCQKIHTGLFLSSTFYTKLDELTLSFFPLLRS